MTTSPQFDSISHFLQSGGFDYRVFDMGRRVTPIPVPVFEKIESQQALYPYPFQKKAWIALLFWPKDDKETEAVIWFLQLPLDEMGYLKLDARDGFLISLLEQAGKNIQAKQHNETTHDELSKSPYAFTPPPDRLAMLHAFSTKILEKEPSKYYAFTQEYLKGKTGYEQWQFIGLQGVADVIARIDEKNQDGKSNAELLAKALPQLPDTPLETFSYMLEHAQFNNNMDKKLTQAAKDISKALIERLEHELNNKKSPNNNIIAMLARGLSSSPDKHRRRAILDKILDTESGSDIEVLVAISSRNWQDLKDPGLLEKFMNKLANQNQAAFNTILTDLIMIPNMRSLIMNMIKTPKHPERLKDKIKQFLKEVKGTGQA